MSRGNYTEPDSIEAAQIAAIIDRDARAAQNALTADDVRAARLDTDTHGNIFPEIKLAAALQVLRSIATEQPTASAVVRALASAAAERLK